MYCIFFLHELFSIDLILVSCQSILLPSTHWLFVFIQGCYSAVVDYFETYIYMAGALAIVVLTIEVGPLMISFRLP